MIIYKTFKWILFVGLMIFASVVMVAISQSTPLLILQCLVTAVFTAGFFWWDD